MIETSSSHLILNPWFMLRQVEIEELEDVYNYVIESLLLPDVSDLTYVKKPVVQR